MAELEADLKAITDGSSRREDELEEVDVEVTEEPAQLQKQLQVEKGMLVSSVNVQKQIKQT